MHGSTTPSLGCQMLLQKPGTRGGVVPREVMASMVEKPKMEHSKELAIRTTSSVPGQFSSTYIYIYI